MLGGYFRNHPAGTPTATVNIEDANEPSTTGLTTPWTRIDEWYNFQPPTNPVVNGGGNDYSPRDSGVKVLATVDEATYGEDDGNATDDDHPVSWCTDFDGGRAWYTAHGPHAGVVLRGAFRAHLLGGLRTAAGTVAADCGAPRQAPPAAGDFEITTLDDDTESPMELAVAKDGRVLYVERITGEVNVIKADGDVVDRRHDPGLASVQENGLMGIALDPNFATNNNFYVAYTPLPNASTETRVSRFTLTGDTFALQLRARRSSTCNNQRTECCHSVRLARLRPRRQPLPVHGRQHEPVRLRRLRPDRRAPRPRSSGTPSARRPTRTPTAARSCASCRCANPTGAGRRHGLHDPDRQPVQRGRRHANRPCPRSSRWASAIRSGSRSTRTPARC